MQKIRLSLIACLVLCIFSSTTSIENLSTYDFLDNPWEYAKKIENDIFKPIFRDADYNIIDFGAIKDGITDCSQAINNAILKCNKEGGGRVIVPEGKFLTGAIHLKSNVNLHISEGATLLFTSDKSKYLPVVQTRFEGMECLNYSPLIYAFKQENIAVTGNGTLDGQGNIWWPWKGKWSGSVDYKYLNEQTQHLDNKLLTQMVAESIPVGERDFGEGHYLRPSFISPYNCKNVLIEGVKIVRSPMWIIHPILCNNVIVSGINIESLGPNNDGCDPECCTNVLIENCYFSTGDDCIAIKSGRNNDGRNISKASENILIRNCKMIEGHGGIVMGSEISGNVKYVFAENCIMDSPNLDRAIRIKSNSLRGGTIEHVYIRNIEVKEVREAILKINMFYNNESGEFIPITRNILLENITGNKSRHGLWIKAYEECPATNIKLINCRFNNVANDNFVSNAENLEFKNVYINNIKLN